MRTVALGEVVSVVGGGTPRKSEPSYYGGGIPWVTPKDMKRFEIGESQVTLSELGVSNSPAKRVPAGSTLVVVRSGVLKHTLPVAIARSEVTLNQDMKALVPRKGVDPRFLARFLKAKQSTVLRWVRATTADNFPISKVLELPMHLPSEDEQRRIVAILDHSDSLGAKRRQVLAHLDLLPFALLEQALGPLASRSVTPRPAVSQPPEFTWVKLTDVARLATGHTPDRKRPEYWSGDISWLSLPEIRALDGQVVERTALQVAQAGIDASSAVVLPAGTVCFSRTASLGFVALMGAPMATSQDFHNWVPGPRLHPEYLMAALRSSRNHLIAGSDGSTHRTIYQRAAQNFHILLPSREAQNEIAVFSKCLREQRTRAQQSVAAHDELFASLQARAFRGEL